MKKTFIELDEHYAQSMSNLSSETKIGYLESVIDKNQSVLTKNGNLISKLRKLEIVEIIEAAQNEIKQLQLSHQLSVKEKTDNNCSE